MAVDMGLLTVLGVLSALVVIVIGFVLSRAQTGAPDAVAAAGPEAAVAAAPQKKKRGNTGMDRLRKRFQNNDAPEDDAVLAAMADNQDSDGGSGDGDGGGPAPAAAKMGKKKLDKLAAKEERREEAEALKAQREDSKKREALRIEEADAKRTAEEEAERQAEAEAEKAEKERKQKEEEEYQAMKAMFSIDDGGSAADDMATESQGMLGEFAGYIKTTKVVLLEELATKFGLKTQDAKMRLEGLEQMGHISGVMDDRGKYIFVSEAEMKAVAKFIRQRGRVSIAELSENSHKLISLGAPQQASAEKSG